MTEANVDIYYKFQKKDGSFYDEVMARTDTVTVGKMKLFTIDPAVDTITVPTGSNIDISDYTLDPAFLFERVTEDWLRNHTGVDGRCKLVFSFVKDANEWDYTVEYCLNLEPVGGGAKEMVPILSLSKHAESAYIFESFYSLPGSMNSGFLFSKVELSGGTLSGDDAISTDPIAIVKRGEANKITVYLEPDVDAFLQGDYTTVYNGLPQGIDEEEFESALPSVGNVLQDTSITGLTAANLKYETPTYAYYVGNSDTPIAGKPTNVGVYRLEITVKLILTVPGTGDSSTTKEYVFWKTPTIGTSTRPGIIYTIERCDVVLASKDVYLFFYENDANREAYSKHELPADAGEPTLMARYPTTATDSGVDIQIGHGDASMANAIKSHVSVGLSGDAYRTAPSGDYKSEASYTLNAFEFQVSGFTSEQLDNYNFYKKYGRIYLWESLEDTYYGPYAYNRTTGTYTEEDRYTRTPNTTVLPSEPAHYLRNGNSAPYTYSLTDSLDGTQYYDDPVSPPVGTNKRGWVELEISTGEVVTYSPEVDEPIVKYEGPYYIRTEVQNATYYVGGRTDGYGFGTNQTTYKVSETTNPFTGVYSKTYKKGDPINSSVSSSVRTALNGLPTNYTAYFYSITAKYGADISDQWPDMYWMQDHGMEPLNGYQFISWIWAHGSREDHIKGKYATMSYEMITDKDHFSAEADNNRSGDIPTHILEDRYYTSSKVYIYQIYFGSKPGDYPAQPSMVQDVHSNSYVQNQEPMAFTGYTFNYKNPTTGNGSTTTPTRINYYYDPHGNAVTLKHGADNLADIQVARRDADGNLVVLNGVQQYDSWTNGTICYFAQSLNFIGDVNVAPYAETGKSFAGWYDNPDGDGDPIDFSDSNNPYRMPDGPVELYAVWKFDPVDVTFNGNAALYGVTDPGEDPVVNPGVSGLVTYLKTLVGDTSEGSDLTRFELSAEPVLVTLENGQIPSGDYSGKGITFPSQVKDKDGTLVNVKYLVVLKASRVTYELTYDSQGADDPDPEEVEFGRPLKAIVEAHTGDNGRKYHPAACRRQLQLL